MPLSDTSGTIDVWKIFVAIARFALGLTIALNARGVWIEVAFVDFRGFGEWYGKLVFACGLLIMLTALSEVLPQVPNIYQITSQAVSLASSFAALTVMAIVGFRVNQISGDISDRARSPERWFEGTILEGFGKILADAAESISESVKPSLTSVWRWILVASIVSVLINAAQLWRISIHKRRISANYEDIPNSAR